MPHNRTVIPIAFTAVYISYIGSEQNHINGSLVTSGSTGKSTLTVTPVSNTDYFTITYGSGNDDVTFSELQLELGSVATSYEPYTGGKTSPSPDYPQEIQSAGYQKGIEVRVTGKNLFGGKAFADKIVELGGTLVGDNVKIDASKINNNLIYKFPDSSKRYTIIVEGVNSFKIQAVNLSVHYSDGTTGGFGEFVNGKKIAVTTKDVIGVYGSWYTGEATYTKFGIFEGEVKESDYEPYKESKAIIPIQGGLLGIPVTTGGNYTDENGQQYICDEIDFARGKYVKRVWKGVLDGSSDENWSEYWDTGRYAVRIETRSDLVSSSNILCNQYIYGRDIGHFNSLVDSGWLHLYFNYDNGTIGLKAFRELIASNPLVVMTYLDAPIETDLTQEQLQAYKSLTTFKQTSIISNDACAQMEVEYVADTKAYIDNKLQEIAQALVASASEAE